LFRRRGSRRGGSRGLDDRFLPMGQPLRDVTFAVLDTETTGISPSRGARLCELAILFVRDGKAIDEFQTLINPGVPIEYGAQSVHGITDEMVAGKPKFSEIAPSVSAMLRGKVLVCHNLSFDKSFMAAEFEKAGFEMPIIPELCTLKLARRHFNFQRNGLGHIVDVELEEDFKIKNGLTSTGAHRALHDVRMLNGVLQYFIAKLKNKKKLETLDDLMRLVKP